MKFSLRARAFFSVIYILVVMLGPLIVRGLWPGSYFVQAFFSSWKIVVYYLVAFLVMYFFSLTRSKYDRLMSNEKKNSDVIYDQDKE